MKAPVLHFTALRRHFIDHKFKVTEVSPREFIVTFNHHWSLRIWYEQEMVDKKRMRFFHATAYMHAFHASTVSGGFTVGDGYHANEYVDDYRLLADICEASRDGEIRGAVDVSVFVVAFEDARKGFDLFLRAMRLIASIY